MNYTFDFMMHIHPFILTWAVFFGAGCIFSLAGLWLNRSDISIIILARQLFPFNPLRSKSVRMDLQVYLFRKLTDSIIASPGILVYALTSTSTNKILTSVLGAPHHPQNGNLTVIACTIAMIVTVEFSEYVMHYLEHKVPFLWELHKLHHSAEHMTPLTTKREHSLLGLCGGLLGGIIRGLPSGLIQFAFGLGLAETIAFSVAANRILAVWTLDPLKHSHIPIGLGWFDGIFISPHMHQIHHSKLQVHWDRNFGTNLSLFDWIFRTGYKPSRYEKAVFGISGYSDASLSKFNTVHGAYIKPMKRSAKLLAEVCIPKFVTGRKSSV